MSNYLKAQDGINGLNGEQPMTDLEYIANALVWQTYALLAVADELRAYNALRVEETRKAAQTGLIAGGRG